FRALWRARSRSHRRGGGFRRAAHSPRVRTCAGGRRALCRLGGAARASRGRAGLSRVRGSSVHESLLLLLLVFPPRSALSFSMPRRVVHHSARGANFADFALKTFFAGQIIRHARSFQRRVYLFDVMPGEIVRIQIAFPRVKFFVPLI